MKKKTSVLIASLALAASLPMAALPVSAQENTSTDNITIQEDQTQRKPGEEAMTEGDRPELPPMQIEENASSIDEKLGELHDEFTADSSLTKDDSFPELKRYSWNFSDIFAVTKHCLNRM